jgi:purine-nucleoside/S-methyl-5'-thioadenosine phosphorylase / adenosine deaminase
MQPTRNPNLTPRSFEGATTPAAQVPALIDQALTVWRGRSVWHGFLGRGGGVSEGPYASLNLSRLAGDAPAAVETNWRRLRACFPTGVEFVQVHQVHGNTVVVVDSQSRGVAAVGDGMVSSAPKVILGILSADCVPILLLDERAGVVAALHAGWRGVIADIAGAGVEAMTAAGARPERIEAALGPAIGACCFEVDIELARRFETEIGFAARHVRPAGVDKAFIDLKGLVRGQLLKAGLADDRVTDVAVCTRCASDRFFSRRAARGGATGLQLSFIGLRG